MYQRVIINIENSNVYYEWEQMNRGVPQFHQFPGTSGFINNLSKITSYKSNLVLFADDRSIIIIIIIIANSNPLALKNNTNEVLREINE